MGTNPQIEGQRAHYDEWNVQHRSGSFDEIAPDIRGRALRAFELLLDHCPMRPRILEVGCGTGWFTEKLCELGPVTAIDLSPRSIELARTRGLDATFIADDFYSHDFGDARYDVVACIETLFYMIDQPRFVRSIASLIDGPGVLALTNINKFVYERSSDVGPPYEGQIRNWLSIAGTRKLLAPHFDVLSTATIEPRGDSGVLRLANSYKLNATLGRIFTPQRVKRVKEGLGIGGGVVMLARKKAALAAVG